MLSMFENFKMSKRKKKCRNKSGKICESKARTHIKFADIPSTSSIMSRLEKIKITM